LTTFGPNSGFDGAAGPFRGEIAYSTDTEIAATSRAAQLLAMSLYSFGAPLHARDIQDDADILGVPTVSPADDSYQLWANQRGLDDLTYFAHQDHGSAPDRGWEINDTADLNELHAFWREVDFVRQPTALLPLLNLSMRSSHEIERVAAAAGLYAFSTGQIELARSVIETALNSDDATVAGIARATLGPPSDSTPESAESAFTTIETEASLAIHGTWARLSADRWYAPEGALHNLLRTDVTNDLYAAPDYFRWTGGYTRRERDDGADDLVAWAKKREIGRVNEVFAHSHGGNVALSAAAKGEAIRLLVLLHTPAIPRSDNEWAAISGNVGRVLVMRTRLDLVAMADGLRTGSSQHFDPVLLRHRQLMLPWQNRAAWFSHGTFIDPATWRTLDLPREVRYEAGFAARLSRADS
jgi:hypothetical protein